MSDNKGFVIVKNGKLLSTLFTYNIDQMFEATKPRDAYVYNVELIAGEIARQLNASVVEVCKPNYPFGDWEFLK